MAKVLSVTRRRPRLQTVNVLPSKTVQSDLARADMKEILRKYEAQGVFTSMRAVDLAFRDVTEFQDFSDLMLQTKQAEAAFLRLPSKVRELFGHDVGVWLDTAHDAAKLEKLRPQLEELGMVPKAAGPPLPVEVIVKNEGWSRDQPRDADGQFSAGSGKLPHA